MFNNTFKGKKVIVTGHTGFKGAWLSLWLHKLGAEVVGISNEVPTTPSLFETTNLSQHIKDIRLDIRDFEEIKKVFIEEKPDYYTFANETKNMTGAEVFAQFSGS